MAEAFHGKGGGPGSDVTEGCDGEQLQQMEHRLQPVLFPGYRGQSHPNVPAVSLSAVEGACRRFQSAKICV